MNAPPPPPHDMVTASDLVRQFGTWRERAARAPVYILHRGRPRLVLTSMAVMDALCAAHGGESQMPVPTAAALLDGSPEMIVLADQALTITATSRSVRARFGDKAAVGTPLDRLAPPHLAPLLTAAATRVAHSSQAESLDLPLAHNPDRPVTLAIEPYPGGVALFGRSASDNDALSQAEAERTALDAALAVSDSVAIARINARGYLEGAHPALSRLTGIDEPTLGALRLVSLFAAKARVTLGEALDAVMADAAPRRIAADLLVHRAAPRSVTVAIAPLSRKAVTTGALAVIAAG